MDGDGVPCGFVVGCENGLLYIKEFLSGAEERTKSALESFDATDAGIPSPSFTKKGKPCYQCVPPGDQI